MTCHVESELGAYVLGALEPEEVEVVSEHLTTCHTCSAEAESLAATAGLLALLRAKDFEQLGVPDPEQGRSGPEARSGRRRTSPRRAALGGAALVGAALTAALVSGVIHTHQHSDPPSGQAVVQAVDPATHVHAAVTMKRRDSGTMLGLTLTGAYPHGRCSLVVRSRSGRTDTAATWVADADGTAWVSGMTAFRADQLSEFDVMTSTGRVLVRVPVRHAPAAATR